MPSNLTSSSPSSSQCASRRRVSSRGRRPPCRGCKTVATYTYPNGPPDPSDPLELRYASLDSSKFTARALVAADDLIVRIFDDPRLRLRVCSFSKDASEDTRSYCPEFKDNFRSAFEKSENLEETAVRFIEALKNKEMFKNDEEGALAFSNLSIRYAQLQYHSSRVTISQVHLNNKIQFTVLSKADIRKGTLILELGGLMSADAVTTSSHNTSPKRRRRDKEPEYNMFSVIRKHSCQCGPGPRSDRLLLGPARFVNHSCAPNCKLKPFPKTNAWGIESIKDIFYGEEITVYYGKAYFSPGECACPSCRVRATPDEVLSPCEPPRLKNPYPTPPAEPMGSETLRKRARSKI